MSTTRLSRLRPSMGFCSIIGMNVSISSTCADSSMTRLSYLNPSLRKSLRLSAACVHVIATTFACLVSR